jgi:hypothetical protein
MKIKYQIWIEPLFGFAIGFYNKQPKKKYKTANWDCYILFLFIVITINITYNYK